MHAEFATARRAHALLVLEQMDEREWVPYARLIQRISNKTGMARALAMEAVNRIISESDEYQQRWRGGEHFVRRDPTWVLPAR